MSVLHASTPPWRTVGAAAAGIALLGGCLASHRSITDHPDDGDASGDGPTARPGPATWPMPNPPSSGLPNPQAYDTATPGVVTDLVTGLAWERDVGGDSLSWSRANDRCALLTLAGRDDWRLPSLIEMVSLVDFSRREPAIDEAAFPDTPGGPYWTSTPFGGATDESWYVAFATGFSYHGHNDLLAIRLRCVRGAATPPGTVPPGTARYQFPTPGIVRDVYTRLSWQQVVDPVVATWDDANTRCQSVDLQGMPGWRLPSMKELQTLIDVGRAIPAIDPVAFPDPPLDQYWTSSPLTASTSESWAVGFRLGITNPAARDSQNWVRCVR